MRSLNNIVRDAKSISLGRPLRVEGISVYSYAAGDLICTASGHRMEETAQVIARMPQDIEDMAERIREFETALEFYADEKNHHVSEFDELDKSVVDRDFGERARKALGGKWIERR